MLAAGALLTPRQAHPAGQLWAGRPAKYVRDLAEADLAECGWAWPTMSRSPAAFCGAGGPGLIAPDPIQPGLLAGGDLFGFQDGAFERPQVRGAGRHVLPFEREPFELGARDHGPSPAPPRASRAPLRDQPAVRAGSARARAARSGRSGPASNSCHPCVPRDQRRDPLGHAGSSAITGSGRTGSALILELRGPAQARVMLPWATHRRGGRRRS